MALRRTYNPASPLRNQARATLGQVMYDYVRQAEATQLRPGASYHELNPGEKKIVAKRVATIAAEWQPPLDIEAADAPRLLTRSEYRGRE